MTLFELFSRYTSEDDAYHACVKTIQKAGCEPADKRCKNCKWREQKPIDKTPPCWEDPHKWVPENQKACADFLYHPDIRDVEDWFQRFAKSD